jgi:hypothetical protein
MASAILLAIFLNIEASLHFLSAIAKFLLEDLNATFEVAAPVRDCGESIVPAA